MHGPWLAVGEEGRSGGTCARGPTLRKHEVGRARMNSDDF
jgi:hypothetical protein